MWIIPKNYPLYSHFAQAFEASKEDLTELLDAPEPSLMWKSKPLRSKTFSRAWKRVYWMPHLSGRILKPFHHIPFEIKLTSYLGAIRVNPSAPPASGEEKKTPDTFGRILNSLSMQSDLFAASSKTSADTSHWDLTRFTKAFQIWTTELRQESLQRRKLARHMNGNDCSFSPYWPTPMVPNGGRALPDGMDIVPGRSVYNDQGKKLQVDLNNAVRKWPTPSARLTGEQVDNFNNRKAKYKQDLSQKTSFRGMGLDIAVQQESARPTPEIGRAHV